MGDRSRPSRGQSGSLAHPPDALAGRAATSRGPLLGVDRVLAGVLALGILVQAVLAGQSNRLFGSIEIEVHAAVGNVILLVAVAQLALVLLARRSGHRIVVVAGFVVAVVGQIGLGYAAREVLGPAAWHVPLGVALFGLSVWNLALSVQVLPEHPASTP